MKNKIFLIALVIVGFMTSCKKQLDIDPTASLSPETVGPLDVQKLMNGVYDGLQEGNTSYFYLSYVAEDLSADNLAYRATFFQNGEVDNNAILPSNVLVARYFNAPYVVIQRANDLLEIINKSALDAGVKNSLLTQTYFLRAYAYYKLVTLFGGVPIVTDRSVVKVPRKTADEVYTQIIADLNASVAAGGIITDSKFASVEASKGLLARVYLIKKDYANAKKNADEVIASPKFALSSDYNSIFAPPYVSTEHIFKVVFTATEGSNSLSYFLQHPSMPGGGRAELPVDISLVNAFEPGDQRKAASMTQISAPLANPGWYSRKYQDPTGAAAHPYYILRISEMYLISAEAQFLTSNSATDAVALGRINSVRTKRSLPALTTLSLQDIIKERRVELAFENTRWMDMRRTPSPTNPAKSMATVYLEAKGRTINDELYPIPQAAIDVNDMLKPNNPGY
ncbi:hypothetical protein HDE69_004297 [Pedobacter cryoconitis]|uniref:RagB/SusD family nutrient uptake outer membrane protein n=1 Tax=Pedobacter cryoconitis TaxID=188932 RepID=A0A7W9DLS5_9SPHI|nr:RagB/SusD family nutrient uptake outer membrane protein [Pedobacter cryoconitis]MBB5623214.1 hypothetical protein [Pedobacter cryoconitis]